MKNSNVHQFVSPLGFMAIYDAKGGRKRKDVYQKVTKRISCGHVW